MADSKSKLPAEVREQFRQWGRKGGSAGKPEDKRRAGRAGIRALHRKLAAQAGVALPEEPAPAPDPEPQPQQPPTPEPPSAPESTENIQPEHQAEEGPA